MTVFLMKRFFNHFQHHVISQEDQTTLDYLQSYSFGEGEKQQGNVQHVFIRYLHPEQFRIRFEQNRWRGICSISKDPD